MRRRVLLGAITLVIVLLVVAIEAVDLLRHPPAGGEPTLEVVDADPRIEVECPDPPPADPEGLGFGPPLAPVPVVSNQLYDCPASYQGRPVIYEGEAVGAVLRRGDHAWVHLNDDVYAGPSGQLPAHRDYQGGNGGVGVRIPTPLADQIARVGGPTQRGDRLRVQGVFHRVHPGSREPAVIIATRGEITADGVPFSDPVLPDRAMAALVLAAIALVLSVAERIVARRRR